MILAIDMGNTNIVLGGIDEKQTYFIERVTTDQGRTDTEYAIHFKNILEMHHIQLSDIEGAILSSVVPPLNTTILNESLQNLSDIKFKEAASMLLQSDHIYIFGVGTSGVLAREAYDFLYRLGFQSTFHEDLHYQRLSANRVTSDSTALLISQSGVNKDIISLAEVLYNSPCKTIGVSNYTGTPFCKYTDLMLAPLTEPSNIHDNNFSFRIPILCILETLYYAIMEQLGGKKNPVLNQNHQLVQDHSINPLK